MLGHTWNLGNQPVKRLPSYGVTQYTARLVDRTTCPSRFISNYLQGAGLAVAAGLCSDLGWAQ